jgi:hypothetical protein
VASGRKRTSTKDKALRLKEIALSSRNSYSERMRAIDLLGQLDEDAYDELAEVAANGLSYNERMNALELLDKIVERS